MNENNSGEVWGWGAWPEVVTELGMGSNDMLSHVPSWAEERRTHEKSWLGRSLAEPGGELGILLGETVQMRREECAQSQPSFSQCWDLSRVLPFTSSLHASPPSSKVALELLFLSSC